MRIRSNSSLYFVFIISTYMHMFLHIYGEMAHTLFNVFQTVSKQQDICTSARNIHLRLFLGITNKMYNLHEWSFYILF